MCVETQSIDGGACAIEQRPSASKEAAIDRWNMRDGVPSAKVSCALHAAAELSMAVDKLADALRDIAKQDPVEMALDPQWAARVASITLTECGYEA